MLDVVQCFFFFCDLTLLFFAFFPRISAPTSIYTSLYQNTLLPIFPSCHTTPYISPATIQILLHKSRPHCPHPYYVWCRVITSTTSAICCQGLHFYAILASLFCSRSLKYTITLHPALLTNIGFVAICTSEPVAYRRGGLGCSNLPPPKFRRYRWRPPSHNQEEPASRFPFVVHSVLIRL